ncbi:MAG: class I SAM-dependent methyltransferase [Syntrophus sp. (in: bacteria)]
MTTPATYNEIWEKGFYREGSCSKRMIPTMLNYIPSGSTINDYGSGTGRAEVDMMALNKGFKINMVDFADVALEPEARALIGPNLTYTIAPLEALPEDFPVADWGICIGVLMVVDPAKLSVILSEIRRTCRNLFVEVYDTPDVRLGEDRTLIKGDAAWWANKLREHWPYVESVRSPEHPRRYITICKSQQ